MHDVEVEDCVKFQGTRLILNREMIHSKKTGETFRKALLSQISRPTKLMSSWGTNVAKATFAKQPSLLSSNLQNDNRLHSEFTSPIIGVGLRSPQKTFKPCGVVVVKGVHANIVKDDDRHDDN